MLNINLDVDSLQSTMAKPLDPSEIATFLPPYRISATEAVHEELLVEKFYQRLKHLERQLTVSDQELGYLESSLPYIPQEAEKRSEAEYRVLQLREINMLKKEREAWSASFQTAKIDKNTMEQLHSIHSRVKNCLNSPLKQQLLMTIQEISSTIDLNQASLQTDKKADCSPVSVEDMDNRLIGLMIAEYIDFDTDTRLDIAKQVFEMQNGSLISDQELALHVIRLVEAHGALSKQPNSEQNTNESNTVYVNIADKTEGIVIVDGELRFVH